MDVMGSRTPFAGRHPDDLWLALCSGLSPKDQKVAAWQLAVVMTAEWYLAEHGVDLFVTRDGGPPSYEEPALVEDFRWAGVTPVMSDDRVYLSMELDLDLYPPDFGDRVYIVQKSVELRVAERRRVTRAAAELAGEEHDRVIWPRRQMDRGLALCGLPGSWSRTRAFPDVGGGVQMQMRVPTSEKTEKSAKPVSLAAAPLKEPTQMDKTTQTTQREHKKPEEKKSPTITSEYDGGPISSIVPINKSKLKEARSISATPAMSAAGHNKKATSTPSHIKKSAQFNTPTTITDDLVYCGWDGTYDESGDAATADIHEIGDGASTAATAKEIAADYGRFAFELARTADEKDAPDDTAHKPHHATMDDMAKEHKAKEDTITTEKSTEPRLESVTYYEPEATGGGSSLATPSAVDDAPDDGKADAKKDDVTDDHDSKADSNGYNPYDYSYDERSGPRHSYVVEYETRRIERHVFPASSASEPRFVEETQGHDDALPENEDGQHAPDGEHGDEHEYGHHEEEAGLEHGEAEHDDRDEQGDVDDEQGVEEEDEYEDGHDDDGQDDQYYADY